jgi:ParB family chromosome partitioning protein
MQREQIEYVDINLIHCEPQVRGEITPESVEGLSETFVEHGQLQPIRLRRVGGQLVATDGHRRILAGRLAGLEKLACIIAAETLGETEVTLQQLISSLHQQALQPLEKSRAFARLIELTNSTASEVAKRLGISPATITRHVSLLDLPVAIQDQIAQNRLPASSAYKLSQIKDSAKHAELADRIVREGMTREGLETAAQAKPPRRVRKQTPQPRSRVAVAPLGDRRVITVRGPQLDLSLLVTWLEELSAKAKAALAFDKSLESFLASLKTKPGA